MSVTLRNVIQDDLSNFWISNTSSSPPFPLTKMPPHRVPRRPFRHQLYPPSQHSLRHAAPPIDYMHYREDCECEQAFAAHSKDRVYDNVKRKPPPGVTYGIGYLGNESGKLCRSRLWERRAAAEGKLGEVFRESAQLNWVSTRPERNRRVRFINNVFIVPWLQSRKVLAFIVLFARRRLFHFKINFWPHSPVMDGSWRSGFNGGHGGHENGNVQLGTNTLFGWI
ncbi:hypothetical protein C8F01DRAFT_1092444 [Mycena amicta]|nr:hypothetical protein C8F01DRAFT_1092444 [Mycena amicta]